MNESPADIIRRQVRLTAQPLDAPADPAVLDRIIDQIGSDEMLLFATDYPHWQFDGDAALPPGLDAGLVRKMQHDNPLATYRPPARRACNEHAHWTFWNARRRPRLGSASSTPTFTPT